MQPKHPRFIVSLRFQKRILFTCTRNKGARVKQIKCTDTTYEHSTKLISARTSSTSNLLSPSPQRSPRIKFLPLKLLRAPAYPTRLKYLVEISSAFPYHLSYLPRTALCPIRGIFRPWNRALRADPFDKRGQGGTGGAIQGGIRE